MLLPPLSHRLNVMCIYTRTHTPAQAAASPSFYSATRVESLSSVQSGRKIDFAVHPPKKIEEFVVEKGGGRLWACEPTLISCTISVPREF